MPLLQYQFRTITYCKSEGKNLDFFIKSFSLALQPSPFSPPLTGKPSNLNSKNRRYIPMKTINGHNVLSPFWLLTN